MSVELSIGSSQGRPAEWHDTILEDGRRLSVCPGNADRALQFRNEHWIGDLTKSDADKFNAIFAQSVIDFNAKQSRPSRKMGPESSKPERQKSYYDGIKDGTFCTGAGELQETAVYEAVLQIGNKDDNGTTNSGFDIDRWYTLKKSGHEDEASKYALDHLNDGATTERTKRILHRAVDRIAAMDPEHLIVLRADYHGDEPCGTPNVHLAFTLRGTGYKSGMTERVASVRALEQMGFVKRKDTEYGIVQLHERFRDIIEEEMAADALEYDYEPIRRKAPVDEKRKRTDVDIYREMEAERKELEAMENQQYETMIRQEETAYAQSVVTDMMQEDQKKLNQQQRELDRQRDELAAQKKQLDDQQAHLEEVQMQLDYEREEQLLTQEKLSRIEKSQRRIYRIIKKTIINFGGEDQKYKSYAEVSNALSESIQNFTANTQAEAREKAQEEAAAELKEKEEAIDISRATMQEAKHAYIAAKQIYEASIRKPLPIPEQYRAWAEQQVVYLPGEDGKTAVRYTIADLWERHLQIRKRLPLAPSRKAVLDQAEKYLDGPEL